MADRYTYLPILGPSLIGGLGIAWVSTKVLTREKRSIVPALFTAGVTISVFLSMSWLTSRQISIWGNGIVLWSYVIEKEPEKVPIAYLNRGAVLYQMGQIDKAIADFDKAIALKPSTLGVFVNPLYYQEAFYKRGFAFKTMGRFDKAIADFDKATELNPSDYEAYNSKGIIYGMYGLPDKAIEQFNKAIAIKPNSSVAYGNRGYVYTLIGQNSTALEDFNKAIELDQRYAKNYFNRGNLYLGTGNKEFAISDFRKACDLGSAEGCSALRGAGR
jgi:tetratricopeptide (TPR) repeat protein